MTAREHIALRSLLGARAYALSRIPGEARSSKKIYDALWRHYHGVNT